MHCDAPATKPRSEGCRTVAVVGGGWKRRRRSVPYPPLQEPAPSKSGPLGDPQATGRRNNKSCGYDSCAGQRKSRRKIARFKSTEAQVASTFFVRAFVSPPGRSQVRMAQELGSSSGTRNKRWRKAPRRRRARASAGRAHSPVGSATASAAPARRTPRALTPARGTGWAWRWRR